MRDESLLPGLSDFLFIPPPSALIPLKPRQPLVQILPADAEDARGLGLVAARCSQDFAYVVGFEFGQRRPARATCAARSANRLRQLLQPDARLLGDDDGSLDNVRKLPHVARPAVCGERGTRRGVEAARGATVLGGVAFKELLGQRPHVLAPLAQRRDV